MPPKVPKKPILKKSALKKTVPKNPFLKKSVLKIENQNDINKFQIKNRAIYLFTMKGCPYCEQMKDEWNLAKKANPNTIIFEVNRDALTTQNNPIMKKIQIMSFPTIVRYNNDKFENFQGNRISSDFSKFMRIY